MKAIVCRQLGEPLDLVLQEWPSRPPGENEVQISVHASSVGFVDRLIVAGKYQGKLVVPFVPAGEAAGTVTALGTKVTGLALGDRVVAMNLALGGLAEEVTMPARCVHRIPDAISFVQAAVFPGNYGTAQYALDRGHLVEGEVLVVHGASGGVGLAAVQLGKLRGAKVIATAGDDAKLRFLSEQGADHVINYRTESVSDRVRELTGGRGADVYFDPVGGEIFSASLKAIAPEGRVLVIGFAAGSFAAAPTNILLVKEAAVIGVVYAGFMTRQPQAVGQQMQALFRSAAAGKLRPHVHRVYDFADIEAALDEVASRTVMGKIALVTERGRAAM